jgi:TRAP-type C4-dicarboxylate transport system permease small subunit
LRFLLVIGCFLVLAYGGWIWSEVIYDQQVINSYAVSQTVAEAAKP